MAVEPGRGDNITPSGKEEERSILIQIVVKTAATLANLLPPANTLSNVPFYTFMFCVWSTSMQ